MFAPSVRIAQSKSPSIAQEEELAAMLLLAEQLDQVESSFEAKINASKAARGERPTKLTRARRAELASLAEDENEMAAQQLADMQALPTAASIVRVLHSGLQSDLAFWGSAGKYTPPLDMPVVQEFIDAKARLFSSMTRFLTSHPRNDD